MLGLGTKKYDDKDLNNVAEVWSYDRDRAVAIPRNADGSLNLEGRDIFLARSPISVNGDKFDYVMIEGKVQAGILPDRTLPKIEGWIPRKNIENFYVDSAPRSGRVNGKQATGAELARFKKTVGAGMTRAEAEKLAKELALEPKFQNDAFSVRRAEEDMGNASVDDYVQVARTVRSSKKRGERLPTLGGNLSTLEDPVEALASTQRSGIRLQVNQDYNDEFKKGWLKKFGSLTNGEFPTHPSQIQGKRGMTDLELKELKVAQRLYQDWADLQKFSTLGDDLWSSGMHHMGDIFEKMDLPKVAVKARDQAGRGNLLIRLPKTVATTLFIHSNPMRQWLIQPQQLMELNLILPEYMKQSALDIPAMIMGIMTRSTIMPEMGNDMLYASARKMSGMDADEFDEVFEAFYETGLPQAVDMNQVLLGMMHEGKFNLDPSARQKAVNALTYAVKKPFDLSKKIGFTSAELANITGTWLFTRQRFIKNNPGVNWNTPENLATITKQAWDISHSMIGNAGTFPYQKGMLGLPLQFQAVQHKGFMQTFMSKTLTPKERAKITAARLAVYGAHGVPFGAVAIGAIVNDFGSDEVKDSYAQMQGGFVDMGTNTLIDIWMQDPSKRSDIQFSKSLTPIPESAPFVDLIVEVKRMAFQEGGAPNPRFPATQAVGSIYEAVGDITNHF
jgi:hypothetical protein